jgi:hypothetical protein
MSTKTSENRNVEGVRPYSAPVGGRGALQAVARTIRRQLDSGVGNDEPAAKNHS